MDDATIIDFTGRDRGTDPLTDLLRKGARELLQTAVEAERDAFLAEFATRRTPDGRAAVVRSGYHPERAVQTGIRPPHEERLDTRFGNSTNNAVEKEIRFLGFALISVSSAMAASTRTL